MTDSRHYASLAGGRVYRFCPHRHTRGSIRSVHGVDERIAGGWVHRALRHLALGTCVCP